MEFSRQEYWSGLPFPSPGVHKINMNIISTSIKRGGLKAGRELRLYLFYLSICWWELRVFCVHFFFVGFPGGSDNKESACNAGYPGFIPGSRRSPGGENGKPLQYSLENPMDRGTWRGTVHRVAKSQTQFSSVQSFSRA